MSNRDELIDYLKLQISTVPALDDIQVVKSVRSVDALNKVTLVVKTQQYEKLPQAPKSAILNGTFLLTLVSPLVDLDKAEDQLDDILEALLPLLFRATLNWTQASQVGFGDQYLAYDITLTSILS